MALELQSTPMVQPPLREKGVVALNAASGRAGVSTREGPLTRGTKVNTTPRTTRATPMRVSIRFTERERMSPLPYRYGPWGQGITPRGDVWGPDTGRLLAPDVRRPDA